MSEKKTECFVAKPEFNSIEETEKGIILTDSQLSGILNYITELEYCNEK